MAKEHVAISKDLTIQEATAFMQSLPQDQKGKVSYIYVTDRDGRLEGVLQVRDLIFYPAKKPVAEVIKKPVVQVETGMTQIDVARLLQRHRYLGLPVVDENQRLVGVISAANALKVFEEEAADDIAKIVGTSPEELRTHSVRKIMLLRLPWLFVNIVSGLLCAWIAGIFEKNIETIAVLFLFVPVVLGLSESTGVQDATLIVRNLSLGNLVFRDMKPLFFREFLSGILIGIVCGGAVGGVALLWKGSHLLGLALACSMLVAVMNSALIGLVLPVLFKKINIDPAIASGPLVLAICDIQTLFVYFPIAGAILAL